MLAATAAASSACPSLNLRFGRNVTSHVSAPVWRGSAVASCGTSSPLGVRVSSGSKMLRDTARSEPSCAVCGSSVDGSVPSAKVMSAAWAAVKTDADRTRPR
ncbi:hypothetical protein G6F63_016382 [Rhizopus arrhizus]|nr:hypothetical protein G6F63_016382 [Rhizopus arrhizus]